MRTSTKPWRKVEALREERGITFTVGPDGKPVKIGEHQFGEVFAGRAHFARTLSERGSRNRVAIKRFRTSFGDNEARWLKEHIKLLRVAKVKMPKMGVVKLEAGTKIGEETLKKDEWVLVSQLLGSTSRKEKHRSWIKDFREIKTPEARADMVRELTKISNVGLYAPSDAVGTYNNGTKVIVFDLDNLAKMDPDRRPETLFESIERMVDRIGGIQDKKAEVERLYQVAIETAASNLKGPMQRFWAERSR